MTPAFLLLPLLLSFTVRKSRYLESTSCEKARCQEDEGEKKEEEEKEEEEDGVCCFEAWAV